MIKNNNAIWFFAALFCGGAVIWLTKIISSNPWLSAGVAACIVLTLMFYYMFNDERAPEEEGDNVYYLGLLFTLISLMFSLWELFGAKVNTDPNVEDIRNLLGNFGIALTSTIVGIAGRVALQNWQFNGTSESSAPPSFYPVRPPVDVSLPKLEAFNQRTLERTARDLSQGANALARFHRIVRSHATDTEDYLRDYSEKLKQESTGFQNTLQRNTDDFAKDLKNQAESTFKTVGLSLSRLVQQVDTLLTRLQTTHDKYVENLSEITRTFHDEIHSTSSKNLNELKQNYEVVAKQSLTLADDLSTVSKKIGQSFENLESNLKQASDASANLSNSTSQTANSTVILEGAVQKVEELVKTISNEAESVTKLTSKAAESIESLAGQMQATEVEYLRTSEALRDITTESKALAKILRKRQGYRLKFWKKNR